MRINRIGLQHVQYMPSELKPGMLYVSKEFTAAAHLCACGCGSKVRTPLGPTEWTLEEARDGPSLYPSIGNWQLACKSHYWIHQGQILWSTRWTSKQIANGRTEEDRRRQYYFGTLNRSQSKTLRNLSQWIKSLLK